MFFPLEATTNELENGSRIHGTRDDRNRLHGGFRHHPQHHRSARVVKLELPSIGETITLAEGCAECMQAYAEKLKTTLRKTTA